ncbi:MAG TPA: fibronectin type III domain-containing protein [Conexibacter sp.]|jgi:hypothetical protein
MQRRLVMGGLAVLALTLLPTAAASAASPNVSTLPANGVTQTAVTLHGTVNPHGVATSYSFQWGTSASYGQETPSSSAGSASAARNVSFRLTGLTPGTTYHFRVVASNADGTTVGVGRTFKTALPPANPPLILSTSPFSPYANSVTLTALVNPNGAATSYRFQFGTTTSYGAETFAASIGAGVQPVPVTVPLSGLQARTTYHFRAVVSNRAGTVVGPDATFTTGPFPPASMRAQSRPSHQRRSHPYFVTTGVLQLAPGVSVADGCNGIVGVRFTSSDHTVSAHRKRLASGHCSFSLRMRALPPRGRDKLRVHVHFYGNAILSPADARSYLVSFKG